MYARGSMLFKLTGSIGVLFMSSFGEFIAHGARESARMPCINPIHAQPKEHLYAYLMACNFVRRLKAIKSKTPLRFILNKR